MVSRNVVDTPRIDILPKFSESIQLRLYRFELFNHIFSRYLTEFTFPRVIYSFVLYCYLVLHANSVFCFTMIQFYCMCLIICYWKEQISIVRTAEKMHLSDLNQQVHQVSWQALKTVGLDTFRACDCDQQGALNVTLSRSHQGKMIGALQSHD